MSGAILSDAVHRNIEADILVEEQVQVRMEEHRVASVTDDIQAVTVLMVEAQRHRRQAGKGLLAGAYIVCASCGLIRRMIEMGDHETPHVRSARRERAGRRHADYFVGLGSSVPGL